MIPFPPPALVWPKDPTTGGLVTKWHVYACPNLDRDRELAELVATAQQVAEKAAPGCMVPVEPAWLHATVHMIDRPASSLSERDVSEFALSLARELGGLAPFTITARAAMATTGGILLDLDGDEPGGPWQLLTDVVGEVVSGHFGPDALKYGVHPPHISAGYCAVQTDSGPVQSALRRARIAPAAFTVDQVHILEVRQHAAEHRYTWNTATAIPIPLGG
jgi:hypothetical protein